MARFNQAGTDWELACKGSRIIQLISSGWKDMDRIAHGSFLLRDTSFLAQGTSVYLPLRIRSYSAWVPIQNQKYVPSLSNARLR